MAAVTVCATRGGRDGCGGCDEDEVDGESGETDAAGDPSIRAKKANGAGEDGDESDSFDEDADEEAFMARMRAARLEQMRATAGTTAQRLSGHGVHMRLREDQPLSALLEDPTDDSPVIAHIAAGDGESEACLWVEDALRRAAPELPFARLVTDLSCSGGQPPDFLPFVCKLPVLLVVERGVVSGVCDTLGEHREPEAVRALISRWLANERVRLAEVATAAAARPLAALAAPAVPAARGAARAALLRACGRSGEPRGGAAGDAFDADAARLDGAA